MISFTCSAESDLEVECFNLEEVMKDPTMKDNTVCKYGGEVCMYTSPKKTGTMKYTYSHQIPCTQFEKLKRIANQPQ